MKSQKPPVYERNDPGTGDIASAITMKTHFIAINRKNIQTHNTSKQGTMNYVYNGKSKR
jgi:hypothetical protein